MYENMKIMLLLLIASVSHISAYSNEQRASYWKEQGKRELMKSLGLYEQMNKNHAKNVIVMIGDGMSLGTAVAGRIKTGQDLKGTGEEYMTSLDTMPFTGLAKTYSVDNQVPDSAATATAILTGVKTDSGRLGVDARADNCWRSQYYRVKTALHLAIEQGKSVGVVTNTRVQHATPAAAYAHAPTRFWYGDGDLSSAQKKGGCKDISQQLFDLRHHIQVVMGGGRLHMVPNTEVIPGSSRKGKRRDGQNLMKMWEKEMSKQNGRLVIDKAGLESVDPKSTDYLMGLFSDTEMSFHGTRFSANQPSLESMTEKAIQILSKNPKGYFLLVENGMIDKGHHQGRAPFAISEFQAYDRAVKRAKDMTSSDETLLVATADHGHVFTMGGLAKRGNPILGAANNLASDKQRYTIITYGNGPGYSTSRVTSSFVHNLKYYKAKAAVPLAYESHSAEDTVIYASGPHAHLLTGVHEQNYIGHVLFYAACLGTDNTKWQHCPKASIGVRRSLFSDKIDENGAYFKEMLAKTYYQDDTEVIISHVHI